MIKVTVEIIPFGEEDSPRRKVLGVLKIANDCTGTSELGNYKGTLFAEYTGEEGRKATVKQYARLKNSVWSLVGAFLKTYGHTKHSPKLCKVEKS